MTSEDVKNLRKQMNLSQADFAEKLGVSVRTVHSWELGRNELSGPAAAFLDHIKGCKQFKLDNG